MKKLLMICALLFIGLVLATSSYAAQKLVWDDPNPDSAGVFEYQAEFVDSNGQMVANPIVPKGTWVDVTVPVGTYTVTVKAHNIWDWSDPSEPLTFTKQKPDSCINLRFE